VKSRFAGSAAALPNIARRAGPKVALAARRRAQLRLPGVLALADRLEQIPLHRTVLVRDHARQIKNGAHIGVARTGAIVPADGDADGLRSVLNRDAGRAPAHQDQTDGTDFLSGVGRANGPSS
jgi:hypothetical protein